MKELFDFALRIEVLVAGIGLIAILYARFDQIVAQTKGFKKCNGIKD